MLNSVRWIRFNLNFDNCRFINYSRNRSKDKSSSSRWIQRQTKDPFVKKAEQENYRCRSAFKLLHIDDKYKFLGPGKRVIDCGASPGSWCQVAVERVNSKGSDAAFPKGSVIGIDLKYVAPIDGAVLLSGCDFTHIETQAKIRNILNGRKVDVVLSDMAPSATGVKTLNHEVIIKLCFTVLRFSLQTLKEDGTLVCKLWMGHDQDKLENAMKAVFDTVQVVKPEASRSDSSEIFLVGRGFNYRT